MFSLYKIRRSENSTSIILLWKILLSIGETFPATNQFLLACRTISTSIQYNCKNKNYNLLFVALLHIVACISMKQTFEQFLMKVCCTSHHLQSSPGVYFSMIT